MDASDKLGEFLKSQEEQYLLTLKSYFIERLKIETNEKGEVIKFKSDELQGLLTIEYVTDIFAEMPEGFSKFLYLVDEFIEPISEIVLCFLSEHFVKQFDISFFEELKCELDIGSDEALLAMVNSLLNKVGMEDLSSTNNERQMVRSFLVNLNGSPLKLLMQSILSVHLGLFGSAKMQIQHALETLLKKITPYNIQHAVVEKSAVTKNARLAAKKGSSERWKLERQVKVDAFKKLNEMKKSGKFKNNSQASKDLTEGLCVYAKQIGCPFTDFFSAQRRIYDWFRAEQ